MPPGRKFEELFDRSTTLRGPAHVALSLVPPVVVAIISVIGAFAAVWVDRTLGLPAILPPPYHLVISVPILVVGLALVLWCVLKFKVAKGTPVPFNPPKQLVTSGPYAYVRHPMIIGWLFVILGVGLAFNSLTIVAFVWPVWSILMVVGIYIIEEPQLERRFGQAYRDYRARVPAFWPRLWSRR